MFEGIYPKEVVGLVFVDSSHENQWEELKKGPSKELKKAKELFTYGEQNLDEIFLSAEQVKNIRKKDTLRNIPIIVLWADEKMLPTDEGYKKDTKMYKEYAMDIASLSNKSKYIFVKNSSHFIQIDQPTIVNNGIKELIKEVKK